MWKLHVYWDFIVTITRQSGGRLLSMLYGEEKKYNGKGCNDCFLDSKSLGQCFYGLQQIAAFITAQSHVEAGDEPSIKGLEINKSRN